MNEETVMISVRCPTWLERQVRIEAAYLDINRSEFMVRAMKHTVEEARREREAALKESEDEREALCTHVQQA